jgi:hypothetical protein
MLVRASLGMTVAISLMGMAGNVWQLVALRLFVGLAGGYSSGSMVLVATQTPKDRSAWALGHAGIRHHGRQSGRAADRRRAAAADRHSRHVPGRGRDDLPGVSRHRLPDQGREAPARKQAAKASGGWASIPTSGR